MPLLAEAASPAEQAAGRLGADKLAAMAAAFARDGVVILANVIPHAVLDAAAARLDYDAALLVLQGAAAAKRDEESSVVEDGQTGGARGDPRAVDDTFGGKGGQHIEVGLPRDAEHSFPEILTNPLIEQCVQAFLGPANVRYWCGNTACPGSGVQPLHQDAGGWSVNDPAAAAAAGVAWPHPNYKLSVNFGVDAMTPANGSTEVWPTSHLCEPSATGITDDIREAQRAIAPPVQLRVPKGGVAFRELRVWHRGQPNASALPRHMVCLGWCATADPDPNVTVGGAHNHDVPPAPQLFSSEAQAQLTRVPPPSGIDRVFAFVPEPVDHWGHRESEGLPLGGMRDQFWDPAKRFEPVEVEEGLAVEPWVTAALDGRRTLRGGGAAAAAL